MRFRDILSIVTGHADEPVIALAEQIAEQNSAYVSTLVVNWVPSFPMHADGWSLEPVWTDVTRAAQKNLEKEVAAVRERLERNSDQPVPGSVLLEPALTRREIGMRARYADIAILPRPARGKADLARALLEGALFSSGRPVLLAPTEWRPRAVGRRVLVAWKPTREAARALGDAADVLSGAEHVTVVTVDAEPSEAGYGPLPGADIAAHLARRGCSVSLANVDSVGRNDARAILDQALSMDADLIVMGGYGHSRTSELIFGGVTRDMLRSSPVPLLLAH